MKLTSIYLLLVCLLSTSLYGQNVKRAYKALEKKEYDKAKESFNKLLSEDIENAACNFGYAMMLAEDKSPFFNIVEAWKYIEASQKQQMSQDDLEIISEYFLNTEVRRTSRPVKKKITLAIEATENRLIKYIREENDIEACYAVLENYPNFRYHGNVVHIRNQYEFRKYEKMNTLEGYNEFIEKFPGAAQVVKAKRYRDQMSFELIKSANSVSVYNDYITKYPDSRYFQQAVKHRNALAFIEVSEINTLEAYDNFIESYPDALEIPEARTYLHQLMYDKAKKIKSLEAYNDFINKYPGGGYYIDVYNLKSGDLGVKAYNELNFESQDLLWAKAFDNNKNIEQARSICTTKEGGFLVAGLSNKSETNFSDAWIIKLDDKGQMIWNKTVGQPYEDDVVDILETSEGKVIVVGYTKISPDSLSKKFAWMFMLDKDGSRLWNKNLGPIAISSCALNSEDKIILTTFTNDTIPDNYNIWTYNLNGNKIAERDFVRNGKFNDFIVKPDGSMLLAGSNWFTHTDSRFYIQWEDTLKVDSHIEKVASNSTQLTMLANDTVKYHMITYDNEGSKKWSINFDRNDATEEALELVYSPQNEIVFLVGNNSQSFAYSYTSTGVKSSEKILTGDYRFKKVIKNNKGGLTYLLEGKDILVISFSSKGF